MAKNPTIAGLERIAKKLATARPQGAYPLIHDAFVLFAVAGETAAAEAMIRVAYDPARDATRKLVTAFGTGPIDVFCATRGIGDLTNGEPRANYLGDARSLEERVFAVEDFVRYGLTVDAYSQFPPPVAEYADLDGRELWRKAQILARPGDDGTKPSTEREALAALTKYMDQWVTAPEQRGAGYGQEITLALDLALRHGTVASAQMWIDALGSKLADSRLAEMLCLPAVARAANEGFFRSVFSLPRAKVAVLRTAIETAADRQATTTRAISLPGDGPIERRVSTDFSQFHLVHESSPIDEVFFQDERESEQGMSIFATQVGIATPTETLECVVEITVVKQPPRKPSKSVVQSVAFPFTVTGPLVVRSAPSGPGDEEDPFVLPNGAYDVLAQFHPMRPTKDLVDTALRRFRVTLDFHPRGALGAPKCIALEYGGPPKEIVMKGLPFAPPP